MESIDKAKKSKRNFKIVENNLLYSCMFLFGLVILMLRNSDLFAQNMLFTEDGTWLGMIYNDGFFHTLINAKPDYFVFGNIILLKISDILNYIFYGDDISRIPMFIAYVQYILYVSLALVIFICLKKRINLLTRVICFIAIILLPFGNLAGFYEIPGRISNVGYIFYPLSFCFLVYRLDFKNEISIFKLIVIDFILFICAATNPACYAVIPIFFLFDLITEVKNNKYRGIKSIRDLIEYVKVLVKPGYMKSWIALGTSMFVALVYCTFFLPSVESSPYVPGTFNFNTVIEFLTHCFLYPFIFPIYSNLNTALSSILLIIFWSIIIVGLVSIKEIKLKKFVYMTIGFSIIYVISTMIGRIGLFAHFQDYKSIFPERYFYSQNIMSIIMFFTILFAWKEYKIGKVISIVSIFILSIVYIMNLKYLFYSNGNIDVSKNFYNKVSSTQINSKDDFVKVSIEPEGWFISVPRDKYFATLDRSRKATPFMTMNLSDENWESGVSTSANILLFPNTGKYNNIFGNQKPTIISTGEYTTNITNIENMGQYYWISIDETVDKNKFAYPAELEFK